MDLELSLTIGSQGKSVSSKLYQKPINVYGYLPWHSAHDRAVFKGFLIAESQRFARACTSEHDYAVAQDQFTTRLKSRGYPKHFIQLILSNVPWKGRDMQLDHALTRLQCRRDPGRTAADKSTTESKHAIVVPLTWDPHLRNVRTIAKSLTESEWSRWCNVRFVVALKKAASIYQLVCRSAITPEQHTILANVST